MDEVLFEIADFPVTLAQASIAGVALAGVLVCIVTIMIMANSARRTAHSSAHLAGQIAERERRIQELDHQVRVERERGAELLDREREKTAELLVDASALRA